jgi:hypothetical protein
MVLPKIEVFDDLVDETLVNEVINVTRRIGFRYGWKSNNQVSFSHWNVALYSGDSRFAVLPRYRPTA